MSDDAPAADGASARSDVSPGDASIAGLDARVVGQIRKLGGDSLLRQLIATFLEHAPGRLAGVREGLGAGDLKRVEKAAHSLRSSLASLGASGLARLAGDLEARSRDGDAEASTELAAGLEAGFAELERGLKAALSGDGR